MELKVWVDGIKRVVCGVTDHTTCQDIVIALAQAMGRTGRFTLIEQWRETKRPLAPNECPLLVLQKWGEFANEVKLILYESGSKQKQKMTENGQTVKKPQDRFTHNFTPPVKTSEAVIRRSLTFSGTRKPDSNYVRRDEHVTRGYGHTLLPNKTLVPPQKVTSDGNSWSSSSSISSQNSSVLPPHHRAPRSSSQDRLLSQDRRRPSPQPHSVQHSGQGIISQHLPNHSPTFPVNNQNHVPKTNIPQPNYNQNTRQPYNNYDKHNNTVSVMNGPKRSSAFSPVLPRRNSSEDERDMVRFSNSDIPVYTQAHKPSQKHDLEEYDLDSNFPDVVKETGHEFLVEEYHVPGGSRGEGHGQHGNRVSWEEEERVKLLRLVTMQNERIKMQDSQLDIIDTEIGSREQKLEDLKIELESVQDEVAELSQIDREVSEEIETLDNSNLIEEMEREKLVEKDIKLELNSLQTRLEKCERDLHQFKTKVKICNQDLDREQEIQKIDEKRRKEEEVRLQNEILELKKNLNERSKELNEKTKSAEDVQEELSNVSELLTDKTNDLTAIEKDLQKENLKFFQEPKPIEKLSNTQESNGEAVIKVLEGGLSPNLSRKLAKNQLTILSTAKGKNGVWV